MGSLSEGTEACILPDGAHTFADYANWPQQSIYSEDVDVLAFHDPHIAESSSGGADIRLDSIYDEPAAQPFQGIYVEEPIPSNSSARPDAQLSVPVVRANRAKDKVRCTRDGCSALLNKDSLARHVEEVHEGKIKATCTNCGKMFKRSYQMDEHIRHTSCGRSL
ncbi:uncharacterized protein EDB93DRAFT_1164067, partial [Suillus bovinus]|uniref:uncharacterized protein n=1 Tax=Suillus bovinus TaxID=48563 RepID=UPI001B884F7D